MRGRVSVIIQKHAKWRKTPQRMRECDGLGSEVPRATLACLVRFCLCLRSSVSESGAFSVAVFRILEKPTDPSQSPKDFLALLAASEPEELVLDLEQVEPAVQLLSTTIAENISDSQSKHFAEQLLHITTDYLHTVIRNLVLAKHQVNPHSAFVFARLQLTTHL